MNLTVAIQAGGKSQRMGQDKGLVQLAGTPLIEHLLARLQGLGDEVLITTNQPEDYAYLNLRMISDRTPGAGALFGLETALQGAQGDYVLVLACDMPFVHRELLEYMIGLAPLADVVVPKWDDRYQTLHAIYARIPCLGGLRASLEQGGRRMNSFYPQVKVHTISEKEVARFDPHGLSFFNVNTPEDLREAVRLMDAPSGRP